MSNRSRFGFTLVELLVVIVIIGVLMALLVPAVIAARETARQRRCSNKQKQLGTGVIQYETAKDYYPGYLNSNNITWVIAVFEGIGKADLHRLWRGGAGPKVQLAQFVCPDDVGEGDAPLSYVANCGEPGVDKAPRDAGIFHDRSAGVSSPTVSSADIADGAQHTLMISERLIGVNDNTDPSQPPIPDQLRSWTDLAENQIGFTWISDGGKSISWHLRSNHPGGVIVTFCDNSQKFINENIGYDVYCLLMTPNGSKVGQTGQLNAKDY